MSRKLRTPDEAKRFLLGVEIEAGELAVRIIQAMYGLQRHPDMTATEALRKLSSIDGGQTQAAGLNAAKAAVGYFAECVNKSAGIQ